MNFIVCELIRAVHFIEFNNFKSYNIYKLKQFLKITLKNLGIIFGCSLLDEAATGSKSEDSRTSGESPHRSNIVCIYIYIRWFMYQQYLEMYMHECIL